MSRNLIKEEENNINFLDIYKDSFVNVLEDIEKPPIALSVGENEIATYGNFSCIVGAPKSRKSFFKSLIIASYIGGNSINHAKDFITKRNEDKYILDFDTEQSKYHSQRVFKRVSYITKGNYEMYKPFSLRKYDFKERLQFIEWCLLESEMRGNIGFCSIDGLADLVLDVNDLAQCNSLVQKLLYWTDISKSHLLGVLHSNYGSKKATGHLGSAVMKKAETVCKLEFSLDHTKIEFSYTRGMPIDDMEMRVSSNGLPYVETGEKLKY